MLNNKTLLPFSTLSSCPAISHLAFADDVVIFINGSKSSLNVLMNFLAAYEVESGHCINKSKSCFIVSEKVAATRIQTVADVTGYSQKSLPIKYLGCQLFVGRKKIVYFNDIVFKLEKKLAGWKGNLLSSGGRLILIKHVLQSLPVHILAAFDPPKAIINRMEAIFANFFGGQREEGQKFHWVNWRKCCLPTEEGGLGVRGFEDICSAFAYKLWWNLRINQYLWAYFMHGKYVKQKHLLDCQKPTACSSTWSRVMKVKKAS